jgi:hypothetical protein
MKMSLLPDVLARFCIRQQLVYDAVNKLSYLLYKPGPTPVSCVYVMKLIKSLTVVLASLCMLINYIYYVLFKLGPMYVCQLYFLMIIKFLTVVLARFYVCLSIIFMMIIIEFLSVVLARSYVCLSIIFMMIIKSLPVVLARYYCMYSMFVNLYLCDNNQVSTCSICQILSQVHGTARVLSLSIFCKICTVVKYIQPACPKGLNTYVEYWPNTTSAWASWRRFDIPVDGFGGDNTLLR